MDVVLKVGPLPRIWSRRRRALAALSFLLVGTTGSNKVQFLRPSPRMFHRPWSKRGKRPYVRLSRDGQPPCRYPRLELGLRGHGLEHDLSFVKSGFPPLSCGVGDRGIKKGRTVSLTFL